MPKQTKTVLGALLDPLDDDARRRFGIGQSPAGPQPPQRRLVRDLGWADWRIIIRDLMLRIKKDRVTAVAGGVTFFALLALFPAMTAFVSLYGLAADPEMVGSHLELMKNILPQGAIEIVQTQLVSIAAAPSSALTLAGLVSLALALYSATGGMRALISALNVAYGVEERRGFVHLRLVSLGFTLGGFLVILGLVAVIAIIPAILSLFPSEALAEWAAAWLRWPILALFLTLALWGIFRWGPDIDERKQIRMLPGVLLASIGLILSSTAFSYYAASFANFNETYGSLGAVIALMMWLWIMSMVIIIGAEFNAAIDRQLRPAPHEKMQPAIA